MFGVRVVPRASKSEIVGEHAGALRVRIAAPPVDGAANAELLRTLARAFKVSRSAIKISSGLAGRNKQVTINGALPEMITKLEEISCSEKPKTG